MDNDKICVEQSKQCQQKYYKNNQVWSTKIQCVCGVMFKLINQQQHFKTIPHKQFLANRTVL